VDPNNLLATIVILVAAEMSGGTGISSIVSNKGSNHDCNTNQVEVQDTANVTSYDVNHDTEDTSHPVVFIPQ
jgi:hypothetical protein